MIITYEAQHAALIAGLQARVVVGDWAKLAGDAADLQTLETLIGKAPTRVVETEAGIQTVMAHPLPTTR